MGLGGGFLMTIWDAKSKKAAYLDARETAPSAATENMFDGNAHLAMYGRIFLVYSLIHVHIHTIESLKSCNSYCRMRHND